MEHPDTHKCQSLKVAKCSLDLQTKIKQTKTKDLQLNMFSNLK